LVGAGHAHVEVLRRFGRRPMAAVRLTLITKAESSVYSGMLPGFVAGHCSLDAIRIPIGPLARFAGCTLVIAEATGFDPTKKSVRLHDGREIFGDVISIDCGARTRIADASAQCVLPVKPTDDFLECWIEAAERPSDIVVVGAGAGGVELALSGIG
jgi:selenide,water dikinase